MKRILIYRNSPFGRMYLCRDGSTSTNRNEAGEHWEMQFESVVAENWIVNTPTPAQKEFIS